MFLVIRCILYIAVMLLVAPTVGYGIVKRLTSDSDSWTLSYIAGIIMMLAIFEILVLPLTFLKCSLSLLSGIWGVTVVILFGTQLIQTRGKLWQIFCINVKKVASEKIFYLIAALIIFQIANVCFLSHTDGDDGTYVAMATAAYHTNTINAYDPSTGGLINSYVMKKYALTPFPIFWAMNGYIFKLHPLIMMRTLEPILFILLFYFVYYQIGKVLLKNQEQTFLFLFFVNMLTIWGYYSVRSTASFLLLRLWQGKAVLSSILLPLSVYMIVRIKDAASNFADWILMMVVSVACCSVSGMGVILLGGLLALYAVVDCLFHGLKNKRLIGYLLCEVPPMSIAAVYLLL